MSKEWYVIHAYSGYENKVRDSLLERIDRLEMSDSFGEIMVPSEEVVEMRGGQERNGLSFVSRFLEKSVFCSFLLWPWRLPADRLGSFRSCGPHAPAPRPQSPSQTREHQRRNSAGTMRQDRREEVKLGQASIFLLSDTQGSARMEGLRARPVKLPKPGLAPEHPNARLTQTEGCGPTQCI